MERPKPTRLPGGGELAIRTPLRGETSGTLCTARKGGGGGSGSGKALARVGSRCPPACMPVSSWPLLSGTLGLLLI